ncbi:MAG TPA: hypothetical protein VGO11_02370 [Chthoniobacteraceae bacterium]|jgi:hypothetical protein|nr:hypothetical protein [Chthoniobacteraceae bacterium]
MQLPRVFPLMVIVLQILHAASSGAARAGASAGSRGPEIRRLMPGRSEVFRVCAKDAAGDTGLAMKVGEVYDFACPDSQRWSDLGIKVSPSGKAPLPYRAYLSLFSKKKRCAQAPWFSLVGKVTPDDRDSFLIGAGLANWQVQQSGRLRCFANDVPGFYGNNSGSLTLTVTRRR